MRRIVVQQKGVCFLALYSRFALHCCIAQDLVHNLLGAVQHALDNRYEDICKIRWSDTGYEQVSDGVRPFLEAVSAICVAMCHALLPHHVCHLDVGCQPNLVHMHVHIRQCSNVWYGRISIPV